MEESSSQSLAPTSLVGYSSKIKNQPVQSILLNDEVWEKSLTAKRNHLPKIQTDGSAKKGGPFKARGAAQARANTSQSSVPTHRQGKTMLDRYSGLPSKYRTHNSRYLAQRYSQAAYGINRNTRHAGLGNDMNELYSAMEKAMSSAPSPGGHPSPKPGRAKAKALSPVVRESRSGPGRTPATEEESPGSEAISEAPVEEDHWVRKQRELHSGAYKTFIRHQRAKKLELTNFGRPATRQLGRGARGRGTAEPEEQTNKDSDQPIVTPRYIPPKKWDPAWGRNKMCERCCLPITWCHLVDAACSYCNVVIHGTCLKEEEEHQARDRNQWVCDDCKEEINEYNERYLKEREMQYEQQVQTHNSTKLTALFRMMIQKRRYKALQHLAVKMQAHLRCHIYRGKFKWYRQKMLRPVKVMVRCCRDLAICDWDNNLSDPYVVVTVLSRNQKQIWRMQTRTVEDTLNPDYNETFVFSGIPAFSMVVFSVVDEDEMRDQFIGQASVPLYKEDNWCKKKIKCKLKLRKCRVTPKESGGIDSAYDYHKATPQGHIEVEITPQISPRVMCGPMMGPSLEEYLAGRHNKQHQETQIRKLWVALCDRKLYLHKHFGDCQAKVVIDMHLARHRMEWKGDAAVFHFQPSKDFHFELCSPWNCNSSNGGL